MDIRPDHPSRDANCLSRFLFWYLNGTLSTGSKRPLVEEDIFQIREEDSSKVLGYKLENIWDAEVKETSSSVDGGDPNFFKVLFRMCWSRVLTSGVCLFLRQAACIAQCVFLRQLLEILTNYQLKDNLNMALYWTIGIGLCIIFQHLLQNLSQYIGLQVGLNLRSAVVAMLYKKILHIPEGSLRTITTNHISNLITDSSILLESFTLINFMWVAPLVLCAVIVILWIEIGPLCIAGIGLILLLIPIQIYIQKFIVESCGFKPGKRETIMNEIIARIQAIKLYCLEELFESKIKYLRREEIESSRKYTVVCVMTHAFSGVIWYLFLLVTFAIFWNIGSHLKISSVLLTLSLSFILYQTMALYFPTAIQKFKIFYCNCTKIQTFLKSGAAIFENRTNTNKAHGISVNFQNVTASWHGDAHMTPVLLNVSFRVDTRNPLVMVVGSPGSGKSSILLTALNELNVTSGRVLLNGSTSYAAQDTWVFPGTIKDNIVFGNKFEKARYDEVIYSCCLAEDVASLKGQDMTLIGFSETSISDELKAKICIARASYHHASIYLFDNLLSLVGFDIGKNIFDRCIQGLLRNKIVILVTNQIQYLDYATNILCLSDDGTTSMGSLLELSQLGVDIVTLLHPDSHEKQWDEDSAIDTDSSFNSGDDDQEKSRILGGVSLIPPSNSSHCLNAILERSMVNSVHNDTVFEEKETYSGFWNDFLLALGWFSFLTLILFNVVGQVLLTLTDYWIVLWAEGEHQRFTNTTYNNATNLNWFIDRDPNLNFYIFIALIILSVIINVLRTMYFHLTMVRCTNTIHDLMVKSLLRVPMSFFDTSSVSAILSRFTSDVHFLDVYLPSISCEYAHFILFTLSVMVINCVSIPVLAAIFVPCIIVFYFLKNFYTKTLKSIRNLEMASQSPLCAHISSTFHGITTIRSLSAQRKVINEYSLHQDKHNEIRYMMLMIRTWIAQRISFIVVLISIITFFAPLVAVHYMEIDPIITSIGLVHIFTINELFQWYVWKNYDMNTLMSTAERLFEYSDLLEEEDFGDSIGLRETWPEIGLITGEGASFAYNLTKPYVLRRLYFCVRPKEKIGIVGNPGSGKTSFLLMLFNMAKLNGTVCIDGYPIKDLNLQHLRKTISIIPEDPTIFNTSLRQNLDPYMKHTDSDIWEALEDVQMREIVMDYPDKLDTILSMPKYNIQERKLLCLARVLLERRKVLVIDGAVPSSDHKTERVIQRIIREKFKDATVIMVAYRLNTIMDLDRVMVIDGGKIVEFEEPFTLLQNSNGHFRRLVDQAGKTEAARLEVLADEARKLRQVFLLQNQIAFPGSELTSTKTKNEILKHFGTRVIYETTL